MWISSLLNYPYLAQAYRILWVTMIILLVSSLSLFAQHITVKGMVKSNQGASLPGVSVILKGTTTGTTTGSDGKYSITVPGNSTLVFSYVGFDSREFPVNNMTNLDVTLTESALNLGEVVVVGYGSQKKKDLTGAVAVIGSKDLENRPNTIFGSSIEGKTAGVQVIRSSGQPQAGFTLRVRGTSSITSGSDPIYIVDGVQTYNTSEINQIGRAHV